MNPDFWNERFTEPEPVYGTDPNVFLASQAERFRPNGQVLCLGEGEGRNAVWLASKGMHVTAVDYAEAAVERTRKLAQSRNVEVATVCADLSVYEMPAATYDGIVSIFVHLPEQLRQAVHRRALTSLRPEGAFVAEYFSREQLAFGTGGPKNPAVLYTVDGLRSDFESKTSRIDLLEQVEVELQEGRYHQGRASVIRVVVSRVG